VKPVSSSLSGTVVMNTRSFTSTLREAFSFASHSLGSRECLQCERWGLSDARRKREEWRETKLLRGACVQTAFHAEQTKLWPLSGFPSEFIWAAAGGSNAVETGTRMEKQRNAYRSLVAGNRAYLGSTP
jgi:hypothetical protein